MHILLVDDHALIRSGISDSLKKHYQATTVAEAESSKSALALLQAHSFDVALVDLFIPGEKLFKLVRDCGEKYPELPLVVLSSSEQTAHIRKCMDLGVVAYVSKSSPQATLFQAIDMVLAGGTWFPIPDAEADTGGENADNPLALDYADVSGLLTTRQLEILAMIAQGQTNKEIARNLGLANDTVKVHVRGIFKNLGLTNRSQAAILGEKLGLSAGSGES